MQGREETHGCLWLLNALEVRVVDDLRQYDSYIQCATNSISRAAMIGSRLVVESHPTH